MQGLGLAAAGPDLPAPSYQASGTFSGLSLKGRPGWGGCLPCLVLQVLFAQLGVGSAWLSCLLFAE